MKKFVILAAFLLFHGCNSVAQLEKRWLGKDKDVLITGRGTPDEVMSDDFGGQIYTYIKINSFTVSGGMYSHSFSIGEHILSIRTSQLQIKQKLCSG